MKFSELIPAVFIQRNNRFTAGVRLEAGGVTTAYVPTTGRLTGALRPGYRVWLEPSADPQRKTSYTLVLTELAQGGLCSVNAMMANWLFNEAILLGKLDAFDCDTIEKEVPFGQSRLDFRLSQGKKACWVEVKSVTYVEDGVGKFPDAPTDRGRKHLKELAKLTTQGYRACVVFIAQREDAESFMPFAEIDPDFGVTLHQVSQVGVEVHAYRCDVSIEQIAIAQKIPVVLS